MNDVTVWESLGDATLLEKVTGSECWIHTTSAYFQFILCFKLAFEDVNSLLLSLSTMANATAILSHHDRPESIMPNNQFALQVALVISYYCNRKVTNADRFISKDFHILLYDSFKIIWCGLVATYHKFYMVKIIILQIFLSI